MTDRSLRGKVVVITGASSGFGKGAALRFAEEGAWLVLAARNLLGTVYGSYYAYRQFLKQEASILINIASELGRHTVPYYASYTASKHGVVGLGDSLRLEIEQRGLPHVHVCTVMPTAHDALLRSCRQLHGP